MRNAIERITVGATRIEILLSESVVAEGLDRVWTLPWSRPSSCRRREIIQRLGEAQQPLRAMRTKARDGFIKALRDAHRWLDELLADPTQTIESLAIREGILAHKGADGVSSARVDVTEELALNLVIHSRAEEGRIQVPLAERPRRW